MKTFKTITFIMALMAMLLAACGPAATQAPAVTEAVAPNETAVLNTTDPNLITEAQHEAESFPDFGISIDISKAVGLDAAEVGGQAGTLASAMAPAVDAQQYFNDRLVLGFLSIDHDNIANFTGLPVGAYLIACDTKSWDCVAVSDSGNQIPIKPQVGDLVSAVESPYAQYEQGSIGGCFYLYDSVKVCVKLF